MKRTPLGRAPGAAGSVGIHRRRGLAVLPLLLAVMQTGCGRGPADRGPTTNEDAAVDVADAGVGEETDDADAPDSLDVEPGDISVSDSRDTSLSDADTTLADADADTAIEDAEDAEPDDADVEDTGAPDADPDAVDVGADPGDGDDTGADADTRTDADVAVDADVGSGTDGGDAEVDAEDTGPDPDDADTDDADTDDADTDDADTDDADTDDADTDDADTDDADTDDADTGSVGLTCMPDVVTTHFVDVTECSGVDQALGGGYDSGFAWADVNLDDWQDLYLTSPVGPNELYLNAGDGTFAASEWAAVELADHSSRGAAFVDYDNDGDKDLYVVGRGPNVLLRNDGIGVFTDVTEFAGVAADGRGYTPSFGDFDNDGWLDLYVANYFCPFESDCEGETGVERSADHLLRNNGDGTFDDVTDWLPGSTASGAGFVGSFVDVDLDGDLDLYVVNDKGGAGIEEPGGLMWRNVLWRNDGPGVDGWVFTERAFEAGLDLRVDGMGLGVGDYDNDLDLDLYVTEGGPQQLLQNDGEGNFVDVAEAANVSWPRCSWASILFDFDNDGWLDLYHGADLGATREETQNPLLRNLGVGTFELVGDDSGVQFTGRRSVGASTADYDQDGFLDLIVGNAVQGYRVARGTGFGAEDQGWLRVRLEGDGERVNRDGIGALVYVERTDGLTMMQQVKCGSSIGSQHDLALHFGLGGAEVESVQIVWPNGSVQDIEGVEPNQELSVSMAP